MKTSLKLSAFLMLSSVLFSFFGTFAHAASLQVTKIGALDLAGQTYTEWWYKGTSPTIQGKAVASSQITIQVDSNPEALVSSDAQGNWSYPTTLEKGDYNFIIKQGAETVSFKVHMDQDLPLTQSTSQTTESTTAVPVTGKDQMIALIFGTGVVLMASYLYIWGDTKRKSVFEAKIIKD